MVDSVSTTGSARSRAAVAIGVGEISFLESTDSAKKCAEIAEATVITYGATMHGAVEWNDVFAFHDFFSWAAMRSSDM